MSRKALAAGSGTSAGGSVTLDPPVPAVDYGSGARVQGVLLRHFGSDKSLSKTHMLVVNLDYNAERTVGLKSPAPLKVFDATTGKWSPKSSTRIELRLAGGEGKLVCLALDCGSLLPLSVQQPAVG